MVDINTSNLNQTKSSLNILKDDEVQDEKVSDEDGVVLTLEVLIICNYPWEVYNAWLVMLPLKMNN